MHIGISINDVVREFYDCIEDVYENYIFEDQENGEEEFDENDPDFLEKVQMISESTGHPVEKLIEHFKQNRYEGHQAKQDLSDVPMDQQITYNEHIMKDLRDFGLVVEKKERVLIEVPEVEDTIGITKHFEFVDQQDYNNFLYGDCAFELYGRGDEVYKYAGNDLMELVDRMIEDGHTVTLFSQERDNSKPSTFFWLSKIKYKGNNVKFVDNYSEVWDIFDMIVTADPYILKNTPEDDDKISIKIRTDFNKDIEADMEFAKLLHLKNYYIKSNAEEDGK